MGFFDRLFEDKALKVTKPLSKDAVSRAVAGSNNTWAGFGSTNSNWDIERSISNAYERVIWIFRCVDAIASNQASIPMYMKEYDETAGHKVNDKNLNTLLNHRTNSFEDSWTFRYRLSSQLLLSRKGAFIELVRAGSGEVKQMYLLDPGTVDPIEDDKEWIKGYKVKRANGEVDELDPDQVIWVKVKAHPLDVYSQMTPIIPSTIAIETDYLARIFNRNFLRNDGRPGMLIGVKGDISPEDAEELKNMFSGGYSLAGQTRVIESDGLNVVDMQSRPRDAQWDEAIKNAKEDILLAFGVPETVLGNSSGRCLRATESVFLASGEIKQAKELVGQKFKLLQPTFDNEYQVVDATAEFAATEKIYKITTFSGRTLETNAKHPLYMAASASKGTFKRDIFPWGWTSVERIKAHFEKNDAHGTNIFTEVAIPIIFDQQTSLEVDFDECWTAGEQGKSVPDYLFTADVESQRSFLSGLYSKYGLLSQHTSLDLYPPSREYAVRLQHLLQRVGVHATIGTKKLKHIVSIGGKINMFTFLSQLDLTGDNAIRAKNVWERLSAETSREHNSFRTDALPPGLIWDRVYSVEEIGIDDTVAISVGGDHSYLSMFWEHNTYNNADSEEEQFWTKTMVTHCDSIARALEPLTGDDSDERYIVFDYTTVDVLQRIERRRLDSLKQDFARGIVTIDDVRRAQGLPAWDVPATRVLYHPSRLIIGQTPSDVEAVRRLPVVGATLDPGPGINNPFLNSNPTGGDGTVGGFNDFVQGELAANNVDGAAQTVNDQAARTLRSANTLGIADSAANPNAIVDITERIDNLLNKKDEIRYEVKQIDTNNDPHREIRLKVQGFIEGHLDSWSDRQLEVVKDRVNHVKVRKGTRHWSGEVGTKALDTTYIVDIEDWTQAASSGVLNKVYEVLLTEAHTVANTLQDQGRIPRVEGKNALSVLLGDKYIGKITALAVNSVKELHDAAANQSKLIANHITTLDEAGHSIPEIQDTLTKSAFDRSRWSINIAKIVTTNAIERLYDALYKNVEGNVYKIWCSGKDEHYREGHNSTHGVKVSVDSTFDINGTPMNYPTEGFDDESIGCSCWLVYGIDD